MTLIQIGLLVLGGGGLSFIVGKYIGRAIALSNTAAEDILKRSKTEIERVRLDAKNGDDPAVLADFRRAADKAHRDDPTRRPGK